MYVDEDGNVKGDNRVIPHGLATQAGPPRGNQVY